MAAISRKIEIDPDTGQVEVVAYYAVDDCRQCARSQSGRRPGAWRPGAGLGQVLLENAVYDAGSGQLVTGSFMDYAMPRAHHMPSVLRDEDHAVPATTNPLGREGRRRSRHHRLARRDHECDRRCDAAAPPTHGHARDGGEDLAGVPEAGLSLLSSSVAPKMLGRNDVKVL